ncbi:MAG: BamA/TamA family outer membrane protein [Fimbriimonadaceae bacterium]|nr:BamA/TamA family outer membrane protein [Chthonomonadaceae bacterium]MCO5296347.1 BamA/TamA family outer membrane protein [Fimbriimonadaceae bacterium]
MVLLLAVASMAIAQDTGVVKEIVINGNQNIQRDAILATMRTKVGLAYLQATLDQDRKSIEDMGFFQAVDAQARPLEVGNWQIVINVVEFPVIKEIRIVGNAAVPTEEIAAALTFKPGQVYNVKGVQPSVAAIRKVYSDRGFFVQIEEFGPMQDSPTTINVVLLELTVNSVAVQGNTRTKKSVFDHLIKTRAGDPYNVRKWEADLRRIYGTQWFEDVKSVERESETIGKVDLIANVKEARTGMFNVGIQVDPRSNFAGLLKLSDSNFRGTGQNVGINYLQSTQGDGASIDLDYGNPWIDNHDTAMQFSIYSRLVFRFAGTSFGGSSVPTNDDRYTERRTGATLGFARPVRGDELKASASIRMERIDTSHLNTTSTNSFIRQDGDVGVLSLGLTQNKRDVDIEPSRGTWARILVEPGYSNITAVGGAEAANTGLGSSTFLRTNLEYRAYFSSGPPRGRELDAPRKVLAVRARYGVISGRVPFFEQFFAGGSDTIRGYAEDRFWGRQTLLTTVEYRYPIQKAFNAILFVDYGGAWGGYGGVNKFSQSSSPDLHIGYGLGFSFRTPLGPIRLDFGFNDEGGSRTHFLIGTSF